MYNKFLYATISSRGKEAVRRLSHRLSSKPQAGPFLQTRNVVVRPQREPSLRKEFFLTKTPLFFVGCASVPGYEAMVERFLEVEVTGLDQDGQPIKVDAWQACILQHECDYLDGILYVDKMVKRTFRTYGNHKMPLAKGCPQQGIR